MTLEDRREREIEEMRRMILDAASEIISSEGLDRLSIRKIAKRIEYSPAIIYHYFKDKDDILAHVMRKGYKKIIDALSSVETGREQPVKRLKEMTRKYINAALQIPDEFMAVQLSSSPAVLEYTASMFQGASRKKPALTMLFECLKDICRDQGMDDTSLELTAQVIAAATFGLIIKLIIEKNIDTEQRERLIDQYVDMTVDRMVLGRLTKNE